MATVIQEARQKTSSNLWIPDFGSLDSSALDLASNAYQGRLYRLTPEDLKAVTDAVGFAANFASPHVRSASLDIIDAEAIIVMEVSRNARPTDVAVRYLGDTWMAVESTNSSASGAEGQKQWLRTTHQAYLPDAAMEKVAEKMRFKPDDSVFLRLTINLKENVAALIALDECQADFPNGAFSSFSLPGRPQEEISSHDEDAGTIDANTDSPIKENIGSTKPMNTTASEASAKYATYSMSEIDRMLKVQAEGITGAMQSKISSQQKSFQDAVEEQEKAFARTTDRLLRQLEDTRAKNEAAVKAHEEAVSREIEQFKKDLSKELEQFRLQMGKGINPGLKLLDDKIKTLESIFAAQSNKRPAPDTTPRSAQPDSKLLYLIVLVTIMTCVNTALLFVKH